MLDLLKDSVLCWRLLNLCITWLVIVLGYYGLSLSSVSLSNADPYLNFFLVSLVEIPGSRNLIILHCNFICSSSCIFVGVHNKNILLYEKCNFKRKSYFYVQKMTNYWFYRIPFRLDWNGKTWPTTDHGHLSHCGRRGPACQCGRWPHRK